MAILVFQTVRLIYTQLNRNRNKHNYINEWKCGPAGNWTRVSRLLVGCLNHSATEPTTLATQLEIDLIVIRSGETYQHIFCSQDHLTTPRSIGDSQSYFPEERNKY